MSEHYWLTFMHPRQTREQHMQNRENQSEEAGREDMLCVNSMGLKADGEGTTVEVRGREKRGWWFGGAPDLEMPLSGERLMAASNR